MIFARATFPAGEGIVGGRFVRGAGGTSKAPSPTEIGWWRGQSRTVEDSRGQSRTVEDACPYGDWPVGRTFGDACPYGVRSGEPYGDVEYGTSKAPTPTDMVRICGTCDVADPYGYGASSSARTKC